MKTSHRIEVLAVLIGFMSAISGTATAIPLMTIQGTIRDPLGAPLANVRVDDGSGGNVVYSDASGAYRLDESSIATYHVTASRLGVNAQSRDVTPTAALSGPIDFTLTYVLSGSVAPNAFKNNPGTVLSITATSFAPPSGQCISWTDALSGTTVALSYQSPLNGDGSSRWTGNYSVPSARGDGTYSWSAASTNCGSITLTNPASATYVIDGVAPQLAMTAPVDGTNTVFTSQRIIVAAADRVAQVVNAPGGNFSQPGSGVGSGILPSSVQIVVHDQSGSQGDQTPSTSLSGEIIRSNPVTLVNGRDYSVTVTASDRAGNSTTISSWFRSMAPPSFVVPTVTISSVAPFSVTPGGPTDTNNTYTWKNVVANTPSFTVTLVNSRHAGEGYASPIIAPSNQVNVTYTLGGVLTQTVHPLQASASLPRGLFVVPNAGSSTVSVDSIAGSIGDLTALVPKTADADSIRLSMIAPAINVAFPTCSDPTVSTFCVPDPVGTKGSQETRWRSWADLRNVGPFSVPAEVAELQGLQLGTNACTGSPSLANASDRLVAALGVSDSLNSNITFTAAGEAWLARVMDCIATHVERLAPLKGGAVNDAVKAEFGAGERDILSTLANYPAEGVAAVGSGYMCVLETDCLVQIGNSGGGTYDRDAVLVVDQGGNDTYANNAGGSDGAVGVPLAVVFDQGGNDQYVPLSSNFNPTIGAGRNFGIGILVDNAGNDIYAAGAGSIGSGNRGAGSVIDLTGDDVYKTVGGAFSNLSMGAAVSGYGFVEDDGVASSSFAPTDCPSTPAKSLNCFLATGTGNLGYANTGGVGLVIERALGTNSYSSAAALDLYSVLSGGFAIGDSVNGGVGVVLGSQGNDIYSCVASGTAYSGPCIGTTQIGLGLVDDPGGNDYYSVSKATSTSTVPFGAFGIGAPSLEIVQGTGLGVFADEAGTDTYQCIAISCMGVGHTGEALFLDYSGADSYAFDSATRRPAFGVDPNSPTNLSANRGNRRAWLGECSTSCYADSFNGYGVDYQ
ncbi:MAG: carboxypeptidase-like regulatory domain-containing protein [Actinomycetota bacterium]